jgi:hypothetical protein
MGPRFRIPLSAYVFVSCACCMLRRQRLLWQADHSWTELIPDVCVWSWNFDMWGCLRPSWTAAPQKKRNTACSNKHRQHWIYDSSLHIIIIIIITWRYSPSWALASCAILHHWSLSWAFLLHPSIPIYRKSSWTSSSHLTFGLPLFLLV